MPLLEEQSNNDDNRDWMDIALEFERDAGGDWEKAAILATNARRTGDNWGDERLSKAEHFLFSRMFSSQSPLHAASMAVATPVYAAGKALGLRSADTPASFGQVQAGLAGSLAGFMGK